MTIFRGPILLLTAVFLIGATAYEPTHQGVRVVYRNASLIDGTGRGMQPGMAVLTDGERIVAVLRESQVGPGQLAGAQEVDLAGKFLIPGLIDSHQHLATPPDRAEAEARLRRDVYSGITGTRDKSPTSRARPASAKLLLPTSLMRR